MSKDRRNIIQKDIKDSSPTDKSGAADNRSYEVIKLIVKQQLLNHSLVPLVDMSVTMVAQHLFAEHFKKGGFDSVKAAAEDLTCPPDHLASYFVPAQTIRPSCMRRDDFYAANARSDHHDTLATIARVGAELDALESR